MGVRFWKILICYICMHNIMACDEQPQRIKRAVPDNDFLQSLAGPIENSLPYLLKKGVDVICLPRHLCVAISQRFYEIQGLRKVNFSSLQFNKECDKILVSDPQTVNTFQVICTGNSFLECGTTIGYMNDSHITYANQIIAQDEIDPNYPNVIVAGQYKHHVLPFECVYPLNYKVLADLPVISQFRRIVIDSGATGYGVIPVGMFLYKGANFQEVYTSTPHFLMNAVLYVGLVLSGGPDDAVIDIERCWATPTNKSDDPIQFLLVNQSCPVPNFVLLKNTEDLRNFRWESPVFRFSEITDVFLHCEVIICFSESSVEASCHERNCEIQPRSRRSLEAENQMKKAPTVISVGPIYVSEDVIPINGITENFDKSGDVTESPLPAASTISLLFVTIFACLGCLTVCLLVAVFICCKKRYAK